MYTTQEAQEAYIEATQTTRHLAPKPTKQPTDVKEFWGRAFQSIEEMDAICGVNRE